jgi:phage-related protein
MRVKHTIEIIVDEADVDELANDFRKLYWNHRIVLHSYKSKTEKIPDSELPLRSAESESSL